MSITYTGIQCQQKGNKIILTATLPDDDFEEIVIPAEDINQLYACNTAAFMEMFGDSETHLWELFFAVNGMELI